MRRLIATTCCLLTLAFGFVADAAHVHPSSDHHHESRGLHLDHTHPGGAADGDRYHGHAHGHAHEHAHEQNPTSGGAGLDARHVDHHDGDAVYVSANVVRPPESPARPLPAVVSMVPFVERPTLALTTLDVGGGVPRAPPREAPPRLRGPPA
jgi:hypothetical protein